MSLLVILAPPRPRIGAQLPGGDAEPGFRAPMEFDWVSSADGATVSASGRGAPAGMPRADTTVLALAEGDVGWHRLAVPKAPAGKLRAALCGVLEEALLDDDSVVHLALGEADKNAPERWVATCHRGWLHAILAVLEANGARSVDRIVPSSAPGEPHGHFYLLPDDGDQALPRLALAGATGVACVRLEGALARSLLPADLSAARWSATPAAAAAAERWLGTRVSVLPTAERALEAAAGTWNLRQFDLAPRHRGSQWLRDAWRRLRSPAWRPVRVGLAALVVMEIAAVNLWAWQQQREIAARKAAMVELLRQSHPQVRAVLDPGVQMARETAVLRASAGRVADGDLEGLLAAADAAWPEGHGPVQALQFEQGRLVLVAPGWDATAVTAFGDRLRASGLDVVATDGRLTLTPAAGGRP